MSREPNKYGLKRYINSEIREKIRRDAGFGCVICGCVFVDYEHIEPEFNDAKEHDPDKMTLLCLECHGRVTRKLISKDMVWKAKKNPKSLQSGYVHDILYVNTDNMEIKIGDVLFKKSKIDIITHGKPIFWFEPPLLHGEPSKICAIFYDEDGSAIAYINRNQFTALSKNQDIRSTATELFIKSNNQVCLVMDREGDKVLHISQIKFRYLDVSISIENKIRLIIQQNGFEMNLANARIENVVLNFGVHPARQVSDPLQLAIMLESGSVVKIKNLRNDAVGWYLNGGLFNKNYELVGYVFDGKVHNIEYEFIGSLDGSYVLHSDECYETGEPIYISMENRAFFKNNFGRGYDVSFRLFPFVFN